MLEQVFLKVINMSRAAGIVIVIVIFARFLLKKFPKYISYMLWSVVLFKLLCPVVLESKISPVPNLAPAFQADMLEKDAVTLPENFSTPNINSETEDPSQWEQPEPVEARPRETVQAKTNFWQLFILYGKYLWIAGVGALFLYCVFSVISIHKRVSTAVHWKENIYIADGEISPFVMGSIRPKIYLPEGLNEKERKYIILHERLHIRRLDHIVKPIAFLALSIHWFNPLVWIAFILFCKDMEMSCDEAVIQKLGETVKADYSASLLALTSQRRILYVIPVDFGEGNTKERVRNLAAFRKRKKGILAVIILLAAFLVICLAFTRKTTVPEKNTPEENPFIELTEDRETANETDEVSESDISLDIAEYYTTKTGNPSQLYYIDDNHILWGSGRNEYGQLGQGTQDFEFHDQRVKIAENVLHVDYSQTGFAIYLTADHKLYGVGNAGCGALQQYENWDWTRYVNGSQYTVTTPVLLMENVVYACCGRDDIVCLGEDGIVWTWGTVYAQGSFLSQNVYFIPYPQKILENAVMVTGGWFNHAALLRDGTVWTWGYNSAGNCGVADIAVVDQPTMTAEGAVMVWTNLAVDGYPQPEVDTIALAWTGKQQYNVPDNIGEFDENYPRFLNNTVIRKADGSYWVCGEDVGTEEKVIHGAEGDYAVICTHEFTLCE